MSPLLTAQEAAELLSVPKSWVMAEARADRIPYVALGRYRRFDAEQLEVWWRERARGPWRKDGAAATEAARLRVAS
jgi:excisionase family DNA binding protein